MILLFIFLSLFSVKAEAGFSQNKCAKEFSQYSQELSAQLRSEDIEVQKNILPFVFHYGADNQLIRESLQYVLDTSPSEDIRFRVVEILWFHHSRAKIFQSEIEIVEVLRRAMNKDSSDKIRANIAGRLSHFPFQKDIKKDFINMFEQSSSPLLKEAAAEALEKILSHYLSGWQGSLKRLKENPEGKIVRWDGAPSTVRKEAEIRMAYVSKQSREREMFKPLLKILRNRRAETHTKWVVLAGRMNLAGEPYGRFERIMALDLLEIIYRINLLKREVMDILRANTPYFERDSETWAEMISADNRAEVMNQQIHELLIYIIAKEPEINISLMRKSLDFLLDVFKEGKGMDRDAVFELLQDVRRDPDRPPLLRQQAASALKDF